MKEIVGRGSIRHLAELLHGSVLVLSRPSLLARFASLLEPVFRQFDAVYYTYINPNPKKDEIDRAVAVLGGRKFDVIAAIGGGSVMDFAKAYRFYQKMSAKLVAVPTTAGTGSEATQFAVVYVDGKKASLDDASMLPDSSIVDSQFIEKAPAAVKAAPAMDAYCQAVESYWAKGADAESRAYAIEAVKLCREHLVQAVTTSDPAANEKMAYAAHLAGKAINISRTTAAHALSYAITTKYGIPHGHAVALSLPGLLQKNLCCLTGEEQEELLSAMGIAEDQISSYFHELMEKIGLADSCSALGIADLEGIVSSVNPQRLANNPRSLTREDLLQILPV